MKTNKHQTLLLIQKKGGSKAGDLVQQFAYTPATARSYLSYLARQDLLKRIGSGYVLTEKGQERLKYFEVIGCGHPDCPLCQGKAGYFTCPRCGYQLPQKKARILPEQEFLIVLRPAGVHCPICQSLILTIEQARLIGVKEEKE